MHMTFLSLIYLYLFIYIIIYIRYEHFLIYSPEFSVQNYVILHSELNDFSVGKKSLNLTQIN
jgi:hypothetical protein